MNEIADLQAQIVALRLAAEGIWLSTLRVDPDGVNQAARLRRENVAAVQQLDASTSESKAMRDAVARHVDQFWGSICWQIDPANQPPQA